MCIWYGGSGSALRLGRRLLTWTDVGEGKAPRGGPALVAALAWLSAVLAKSDHLGAGEKA